MRYSCLTLALTISLGCATARPPEQPTSVAREAPAVETRPDEQTAEPTASALEMQAADPVSAEDLRRQCDEGGPRACLRLCEQEGLPCTEGRGSDCRALLREVDARGGGEIQVGLLYPIGASELAPTQGAVGGVAAQCRATGLTERLRRYQEEDDEWKFPRYLIRRPVPMVIGPAGRPYITDRHHLSTGLLRSGIPDELKVLYVCPMAQWNGKQDFWKDMEANNFAWLHDRTGARITPEQLPETLAEISDDPYRTLSRWVRNSCGYIKCGTECGGDGGPSTSELEQCRECSVSPFYLEFRWADFLREVVSIEGIYDLACDQSGPNCQTQSAELQGHLGQAMQEVRKSAAVDAGLPGWNFSLIQTVPVQFDPEGCDL